VTDVSAPSPNGIRYGVLTIGKENGDYVIHAGNLVQRSDVKRLRTELSRIRHMNKEELRVLYKEQLRGDPEKAARALGSGLWRLPGAHQSQLSSTLPMWTTVRRQRL